MLSVLSRNNEERTRLVLLTAIILQHYYVIFSLSRAKHLEYE